MRVRSSSDRIVRKKKIYVGREKEREGEKKGERQRKAGIDHILTLSTVYERTKEESV